MLRTFNCGIGMAVLARADRAAAIIRESEQRNIPCFEIGAVVDAGRGPRVRYIP
jgi:phosphoribosylaminoimidazole (AIR) synthetase